MTEEEPQKIELLPSKWGDKINNQKSRITAFGIEGYESQGLRFSNASKNKTDKLLSSLTLLSMT